VILSFGLVLFSFVPLFSFWGIFWIFGFGIWDFWILDFGFWDFWIWDFLNTQWKKYENSKQQKLLLSEMKSVCCRKGSAVCAKGN